MHAANGLALYRPRPAALFRRFALRAAAKLDIRAVHCFTPRRHGARVKQLSCLCVCDLSKFAPHG